MLALIPVLLTYLPEILAAGEAGYKFVSSVRAAAKQSGEWTPENEEDFQAQIAKQAIDPAWQLDAPPAPVSESALLAGARGALTAAVVTAASTMLDAAKETPAPVPAPALPAETATPPAVTDQAAAAPAPAPEPASTDPQHPVCPTCGKVCPPDATGNCSCPQT